MTTNPSPSSISLPESANPAKTIPSLPENANSTIPSPPIDTLSHTEPSQAPVSQDETSNITIVKPPKPSPSLTISGCHASVIPSSLQTSVVPDASLSRTVIPSPLEVPLSRSVIPSPLEVPLSRSTIQSSLQAGIVPEVPLSRSVIPSPLEAPLSSYPRGPPPRGLLLRGHPYPGPRGLMPRVPPPRLPINRGLRPDLIMMVPPVPPGIPADLWEWFFHSDEDKDGRITASEVQRLLLKGKWSPIKEETCKMMLDMMDVDKIGTLDAYQMTLLWNSMVEWKNIFDELDTEKRGCLNASQIFKALEKFGYRLSSEFCDAVVDRFGVNYDEKGGEQVLYFDDFIQTRVMLKSLTESFQLFDTNKAGVIDLHYEQFLEMVLTNAM